MNTTSHSEYEDLCAAFAVGALDGPDREKLRAHLPTCSACRQRVADFEQSAAWLALGLPPIQPSAKVKSAVMQRISGQHGQASRQGGGGPGLLTYVALGLAGLALVSAAGMGVLFFKTSTDLDERTRERDSLDSENDLLKARVSDLEKVQAQLEITREQLARKTADLATLQDQHASLSRDFDEAKKRLARLEKIERLLEDVDTRVVDLAATGPAAGSDVKGRVLWKGEDVVFIAEAMPALNGKTYELWAIDPARGAQKAGLFSDLAPGGTVLDVRELGFHPGNVAKFAISVEPAGGSPNRNGPTGDIILINP